MVNRGSKVHNSASSLILLVIITRSGRLAENKRFICISKPQSSLYISFSRTDSGLCIYHLFVCSNFNFLHNSQWINLPTEMFYSFCASSLHLLIMWSFCVYHHIIYICCFVAFCLSLLWYDWFLWPYFVLLLEEIQFLSKCFPFLATSTFSYK